MFEKNHDILLHPKGATTMPTGIKVLVCDDDAAFCQKIADLVRRNQPEDGGSVAVTICCDPTALTDKALGKFDIAFLDIDMGAYSGLELARHIRSLNLVSGLQAKAACSTKMGKPRPILPCAPVTRQQIPRGWLPHEDGFELLFLKFHVCRNICFNICIIRQTCPIVNTFVINS